MLTSGKLALVWSPDAVNDAGFMDDYAVFVYPICHGRSSEHGCGDQSYRNKFTHLRVQPFKLAALNDATRSGWAFTSASELHSVSP